MKKLTIQEVQNIELEILNVFVKFCEDNQLTYMLCGGTLLGAVRHKGFIPWDDDVDILMPRPDYERLLNEDNINWSALGNAVEIWHWKNGKLKQPYIKCVKCDTKVFHGSRFIREKIQVGKIYIDIFPLDGNPEREEDCEKFYRKVSSLRKILMVQMAKIGAGKTWYAKMFKPFAVILLQLIPTRFLCKKIDCASQKYNYNESVYTGGVLWGYGICERMKKEKYQTDIKLEFEGGMYNVPVGYHEYLSNLYGDYMELPPMDKRRGHLREAYVEE